MILLLATAYAADLTMEIHNLQTDQGTVMCTLYSSAESWLADPGWTAVAKAKPIKGSATCTFADLPEGRYAVSFIHDVNNNGDMDNTWLGLPSEPWGFSLDPSVTFGPPRFEAAAFNHPSSSPIRGTAR